MPADQSFEAPPESAVRPEPSAENAGVQFAAPPEGAEEQAAVAAPGALMAGIPSQILDARGQLEETLRAQAPQAQVTGALSAQNMEGTGNIQAVAVGVSEPGGPGAPGEPVLSVFVAEPTTVEQARTVAVDAMGVQAARDVPMQVLASGVFEPLTHTFRIRPAPAGVSIGHPKVTAGTLGCLAIGRTSPRNSRLLLLSNNHVIANSNNAVYGDCIAQPGYYDGGRCPNDQIAILERFVPITFGGACNYVDCATGWCWPDRVRREHIYWSYGWQYFRTSGQVIWPQLNLGVGKTGRTTQLTSGRVVALGWSGWINYGVGYAWFCNQFVVQAWSGDFSRGGDSGSHVWTWDSSRHAVGLLFAGGGGYTICNPMAYVVSALDIYLYT